MKLYFSPTSPYVRKVIILARETGLEPRIERVAVQPSPVSRPADLAADAPLGKVPALVTEDGAACYDSRVICQYLDTLHDGTPLIPAAAPARFDALRREAMADGLLDAALLARYEIALRPEALRWEAWLSGQMAKITGVLDAMEAEAATAPQDDLGAIAWFCALGYLDFRFADMGWRTGRPTLAAWCALFAERPSVAGTGPD
ncbi:glutathione S-transferase (plasmid) [Paroceanicella profunda]|uniref:Glutathione S-transferase n=1 Tax=Paroceanicella profunda TaxID=2579971 RepID=A0A5B8FYU4_9RHOB|nr:glutathione S-transferase N-terminal domain-containing protein [Paroceanicella profunda]QDL94076.1 glutathione S-transferase [Paroceanicella profunda]